MNFSKMHGLGNDFIVINNLRNEINISKKDIIKLCERKFGIGADGLILVEKSSMSDIKMSFFNSDGSEVEMCGNGIRCFAKFVYDNDIIKKDILSVETLAGEKITKLIVEDSKVEQVRVNMGKCEFSKEKIPVISDKDIVIDEKLFYNDMMITYSCASMGNPHTVIEVNDLNEFPVKDIGPYIENHKLFPKMTNVNFTKIIDSNNIELITWERGVGLTLACGTGACATVAVLNKKKLVNNSVNVKVPGGNLFIEIKDDVYMTGPAEQVFNGLIQLSEV